MTEEQVLRTKREHTFREWQTARDAALAFLGLGGLLLLISLGVLIVSLAGGYGWIGWFAYYVGPASLILGLTLTPLGTLFASKSRRIRPDRRESGSNDG